VVYLDTNILIYLFEQHDPYTQQVVEILDSLIKHGGQLLTSAITVTEFLAGTTSSTLKTLKQVPNLTIMQLDENLAEQAAMLQKKHKIQIGDCIHLATAIQGQAESLFTNDKHLSKIAGEYISVISL
jgi:predicted nucleic acid-binding protein